MEEGVSIEFFPKMASFGTSVKAAMSSFERSALDVGPENLWIALTRYPAIMYVRMFVVICNTYETLWVRAAICDRPPSPPPPRGIASLHVARVQFFRLRKESRVDGDVA